MKAAAVMGISRRHIVVLALAAATALSTDAGMAGGAADSDPGSASPLGLWKTFDDKTGAARAIVRVYEEHGRLFGRLEHSFSPGAESRVCAVCSDERKDRAIIGLIIIRNMKADGDGFGGGDILDPESGTVYRCKMHLEQAGSRLIVRGYIGFALLGRSQTWQRQD